MKKSLINTALLTALAAGSVAFADADVEAYEQDYQKLIKGSGSVMNEYFPLEAKFGATDSAKSKIERTLIMNLAKLKNTKVQFIFDMEGELDAKNYAKKGKASFKGDLIPHAEITPKGGEREQFTLLDKGSIKEEIDAKKSTYSVNYSFDKQSPKVIDFDLLNESAAEGNELSGKVKWSFDELENDALLTYSENFEKVIKEKGDFELKGLKFDFEELKAKGRPSELKEVTLGSYKIESDSDIETLNHKSDSKLSEITAKVDEFTINIPTIKGESKIESKEKGKGYLSSFGEKFAIDKVEIVDEKGDSYNFGELEGHYKFYNLEIAGQEQLSKLTNRTVEQLFLALNNDFEKLDNYKEELLKLYQEMIGAESGGEYQFLLKDRDGNKINLNLALELKQELEDLKAVERELKENPEAIYDYVDTLTFELSVDDAYIANQTANILMIAGEADDHKEIYEQIKASIPMFLMMAFAQEPELMQVLDRSSDSTSVKVKLDGDKKSLEVNGKKVDLSDLLKR